MDLDFEPLDGIREDYTSLGMSMIEMLNYAREKADQTGEVVYFSFGTEHKIYGKAAPMISGFQPLAN